MKNQYQINPQEVKESIKNLKNLLILILLGLILYFYFNPPETKVEKEREKRIIENKAYEKAWQDYYQYDY